MGFFRGTMRLVSDPVPPGVSVCRRGTRVGSGSVKAGEAGQRALDSLSPSRTPSSGKNAPAYQRGGLRWYRDELYCRLRSCRRRMRIGTLVYELP